LGGLRATYNVHLVLIGKSVVDFLLVLIELFSLGVTAESLRAKRDRKSAISLQLGHFNPIFQVDRVTPTNTFALLVRPMNALQTAADSFHTKKLCSRSAIFYGNRPFCVSETPFGDLGATYDDHLSLIGKRIVDVS